jgi:thioredoxin reductase (NADPH)
MVAQGTKIIEGVTPTSIEKVSDNGRDRLKVTYSNGVSDIFDTVLCATGRNADTLKLNLPSLGVTINTSNGKVVGTNEQTTVPHIYAIGDIVDTVPELTPVAIMSGRLLAKRLFGNTTGAASEYMNYKHVPTTVFTPLELGTVGYSEEQAIAEFGEDAIDSYISNFTPLEMTMLHLEGNPCIAKIVVNVLKNNTVLGIHIAAPNAGEIIGGSSAAIKKGITLEELNSVVGVHPTIGEELVGLTISKSSGANANKAGC